MSERWPLVGRDAEVTAVLAAVRHPDDHGVLIVGPAGVGKTRLALECAMHLRKRSDVAVREVRASRAAASIPLGALAPVLPSVAANDVQHLRQSVDALSGLAPAGGRLVLVVDDLHALDDASSAVIHQLVAHSDAFVVGTVRVGEEVPDAVTALWKDDLLRRIDLSPLGPGEVERMLASVLGGPIDGALVHWLFEASKGNALYLRELVRGLVEQGDLNDGGGLWHLDDDVKTPPRVVELVGARLDGLAPDERTVLCAVALSEPVPVAAIDRLSGDSSVLDGLEAKGMVECAAADGRLEARVAHPLYGEVARGRLTARAHHELAVNLSEAIEATAPDPSDARRAAMLRVDAGVPADPSVVLAAARSARLASDADTAVRLARVVWDESGQPAAGHLLGESLDARGNHAEAEQVLASAQARCVDDHELAMVALARGDNLFRGLGRAEEAEQVVLDVEARLRDPELRDRCIAQRAIFRLFEGRFDDTIELAGPLLARRGDDRAYCEAALQVATAMALSGRATEAVEVSRRAFEVRIAIGDDVQLSAPGVFLVSLSIAELELGRVQLALDTAMAGHDGAIQARNRDGQAWFAAAISRAHLFAGRLDAAAVAAREVAVAFSYHDHPAVRWGLGGLALAHGHLGQVAEGRAALDELAALPPTPLRMMDVELVERGRAWLHAAEGDLVGARAILLEAAELAAAGGGRSVELAVLHDVARLGGAAEVADRVRDLAVLVDGDLAAARVAMVRSAAAGDAGGLVEAGERFEQMGCRLWAAECFAEAAAATRGGARVEAGLRQRAAGLAASCEGASTPMLRATSESAQLTKREREIATLAASGMSNKDIAAKLVVSTRTVENHLQRAYEKLGVRRRTELAGALELLPG